MNDTQWPRWEVFKKDSAKKPFQAVGSVHAADPEHALLNARNVFVRRPQAVALWVTPAEAIFQRTAEELAADEAPSPPDPAAPLVAYELFCKTSHRRSMTFVDHLGAVEAASPALALAAAQARWPDIEGLVWWVVPAAQITATPDGDDIVDAWFDPAKEKTYRQQSAYGFVRARRSGHRPSQSDNE